MHLGLALANYPLQPKGHLGEGPATPLDALAPDELRRAVSIPFISGKVLRRTTSQDLVL